MVNDVEGKIIEIVMQTVKNMSGFTIELTNDLSLIDGGILDSLSIVNVVQGLQEAFDIEIMVSDITLDNFDTVQLVGNFVKERLT